jgi:hypothetical protein
MGTSAEEKSYFRMVSFVHHRIQAEFRTIPKDEVDTGVGVLYIPLCTPLEEEV